MKGRRGSARPLAVAAALLWAAEALAQAPPSAPASSSGPTTLDFELHDASGTPVGWQLSNGAAVDAQTSFDGTYSLRLAGDGDAGATGARATLRLLPPTAGNRTRIGLQIKVDDAESIDVLLRIDGADGLIYFDRVQQRFDAPSSRWHRLELDAPTFKQATSLQLSVSVARGSAWIDAVTIGTADTSALPAPAPAARRYIEYVLDQIDRHSIYRSSLDWPAYRRAVLEQARGATTAADAHLAVRYALGELGDRHAYLRAAERAETLGRAPVSNARTGRPPIAPTAERLPRGVAYLTVPGFAGGQHVQQVEFAETLQALIRSLDSPDTCGWIVDLRGNSGGNLWPMLLGLGPLLGDGDVVSVFYPDGRRESLWHQDGKVGLDDFARLRLWEPYQLTHADSRVALLLGPRTASAAEVLAMAFRGTPNQRSFGAETGGLHTGTRTFVLLDGAELVLAVTTMGDRTGRAYHGPLQPDVAVGGRGNDGPLLGQPEVDTAMAWLTERCQPAGH